MRSQLKANISDVEVLTSAEFRDRSLRQWLFRTGAGLALIGGAVLGIMVGTVIVAQTLYSSTKDHLNEFATLRALDKSIAACFAQVPATQRKLVTSHDAFGYFAARY